MILLRIFCPVTHILFKIVNGLTFVLQKGLDFPHGGGYNKNNQITSVLAKKLI